jgi:hypothetical protein
MDYRKAFASLQSLVGQWIGESQNGQTVHVTYSRHAHDSVLMEHWELRSTDALTLYHLDGETVMATHYCPLCNQPRLDLVDADGMSFRFACVGATNLKSPEDEHQHAFEIRLIDETHFWRSETYMANSVTTFFDAITFERVTG